MKDQELNLEEIEVSHTPDEVDRDTRLSDVLQSIGLGEPTTWSRVRFRKKPKNLCVCESKERRYPGEDVGVCVTRLSDERQSIGLTEPSMGEVRL